MDRIHLHKDNGGIPVASDHLNAQAASLRQHKYVSKRTGTFVEDENSNPAFALVTIANPNNINKKKQISRQRGLNPGPPE